MMRSVAFMVKAWKKKCPDLASAYIDGNNFFRRTGSGSGLFANLLIYQGKNNQKLN